MISFALEEIKANINIATPKKINIVLKGKIKSITAGRALPKNAFKSAVVLYGP